jgi:hypothetical protein
MTLRKRSWTSHTNTTALDGSNRPPVEVPLLFVVVMEAAVVVVAWRARRRAGGDEPALGVDGRKRLVVMAAMDVRAWRHPSCDVILCSRMSLFQTSRKKKAGWAKKPSKTPPPHSLSHPFFQDGVLCRRRRRRRAGRWRRRRALSADPLAPRPRRHAASRRRDCTLDIEQQKKQQQRRQSYNPVACVNPTTTTLPRPHRDERRQRRRRLRILVRISVRIHVRAQVWRQGRRGQQHEEKAKAKHDDARGRAVYKLMNAADHSLKAPAGSLDQLRWMPAKGQE